MKYKNFLINFSIAVILGMAVGSLCMSFSNGIPTISAAYVARLVGYSLPSVVGSFLLSALLLAFAYPIRRKWSGFITLSWTIWVLSQLVLIYGSIKMSSSGIS